MVSGVGLIGDGLLFEWDGDCTMFWKGNGGGGIGVYFFVLEMVDGQDHRVVVLGEGLLRF